MNIRWLLRAKRMAQNPPSEARFWLVVGVIAVCALLWGIEHIFGWPEWLSADDMRKLRVKPQ
ncbi:hypothetical protein SAMN04488005_1442 [Yoonia tamlensis]|uniref:Uncharacterized protein n=1 Tax=Yoonia tamlensis TaxID=390270 RepID=A0A1I6GD74_9RHOB|nr:hypothetical protein [Yoonia tamlensis]SFR40037.1 hypothetical protein SAMN04488005_1442 [Yoonia tamlensis]